MDFEFKSGSLPEIPLDVKITGLSHLDYDKRLIRKALNQGGAEVRKAARRLVSRRAISHPGEFPGQDSGALMRSIQIYKRGTRGGWVKIGPTKTEEMSVFYPAFLFYGVRGLGRIQKLAPGEGRGKSNRRGRGERAALKAQMAAITDYSVAARGNYMAAALDQKREALRAMLRAALPGAIKPR